MSKDRSPVTGVSGKLPDKYDSPFSEDCAGEPAISHDA